MPTNGMNTGTDYQFLFYGPNGALLAINDIQDVKVDAQKHDLKNQPYNGVPAYGFVPPRTDGYAGTEPAFARWPMARRIACAWPGRCRRRAQ